MVLSYIAFNVVDIKDGEIYLENTGEGLHLKAPKDKIPFAVSIGERITCKGDLTSETYSGLNLHDWERTHKD